MDYETYKQNRVNGMSPEEAFNTVPDPRQGFSFGRTIGNIPKSAGEFLGGVGSAIIHPVRTAKALGSVAAGGVEKLIPGTQAEEQSFNAVADFYKNRYGSVDKLLKTIENDPVGFVSDASVLFTGGGAAASKVGQLSKVSTLEKVGQVASKVGEVTNPLNAVGTITSQAQKAFPWLARSLEQSNLRLTPSKAGQLAVENVVDDGIINLTKSRLNEVTDFMARQKIIGNPQQRYAKASLLYQQTEDALDGFMKSISKNAGVKPERIMKSLNGLKSIFRGNRDIESVSKQVDGAIRAVNKIPRNKNGLIQYQDINTFKRSTYKNAYNKAGDKVVDGVEHSIGDVMRGFLESDLKGLKIGGKNFDEFNQNYGKLIDARKLMKAAVGKREISKIHELMLGTFGGYMLGQFTGLNPVGSALGGGAFGSQLIDKLPITGIKSLIGAGAQTVGELKLPSAVGKLKKPLQVIERVKAGLNN